MKDDQNDEIFFSFVDYFENRNSFHALILIKRCIAKSSF